MKLEFKVSYQVEGHGSACVIIGPGGLFGTGAAPTRKEARDKALLALFRSVACFAYLDIISGVTEITFVNEEGS